MFLKNFPILSQKTLPSDHSAWFENPKKGITKESKDIQKGKNQVKTMSHWRFSSRKLSVRLSLQISKYFIGYLLRLENSVWVTFLTLWRMSSTFGEKETLKYRYQFTIWSQSSYFVTAIYKLCSSVSHVVTQFPTQFPKTKR